MWLEKRKSHRRRFLPPRRRPLSFPDAGRLPPPRIAVLLPRHRPAPSTTRRRPLLPCRRPPPSSFLSAGCLPPLRVAPPSPAPAASLPHRAANPGTRTPTVPVTRPPSHPPCCRPGHTAPIAPPPQPPGPHRAASLATRPLIALLPRQPDPYYASLPPPPGPASLHVISFVILDVLLQSYCDIRRGPLLHQISESKELPSVQWIQQNNPCCLLELACVLWRVCWCMPGG
ncbi:leucine-rich repeat extensin-like protein 3 [Triticum urartu]|uniref:leucine-rich repeat extensin-like protein 3 n=1 Tax=Triticum urartu TaxID=4572 RepID=UPI002042E9F2|nr:leucine-rich repeat extensin-like protein 3 [Triticum urartu]